MEDDLLAVADQNLAIWEHYLNGIGDAGDVLNKSLKTKTARKAKKAA